MVPGPTSLEVPVLVFTRTPIPGMVKTRLVPALGARGAARLHREMLRRTIDTAVAADVGRVRLCCSPSIDHPFLLRLARSFGVELLVQSGDNLGTRMHHALAAVCGEGGGALLVGSDCPSMPPADLREAARALGRGADAVLGPAHDGGYYLIGVRRSDSRIFSAIEWGSSRVLETTRERLRTLGWRWHELAVRHDVDRPEDLASLEALRGMEFAAKAPIF